MLPKYRHPDFCDEEEDGGIEYSSSWIEASQRKGDVGTLLSQMALDFTVVLTLALFELKMESRIKIGFKDFPEKEEQLGRRVMGLLPSKWL